MTQVTKSQQALPDADLEVLKSALSAFFSKQQGPSISRPYPIEPQEDHH